MVELGVRAPIQNIQYNTTESTVCRQVASYTVAEKGKKDVPLAQQSEM